MSTPSPWYLHVHARVKIVNGGVDVRVGSCVFSARLFPENLLLRISCLCHRCATTGVIPPLLFLFLVIFDEGRDFDLQCTSPPNKSWRDFQKDPFFRTSFINGWVSVFEEGDKFSALAIIQARRLRTVTVQTSIFASWKKSSSLLSFAY